MFCGLGEEKRPKFRKKKRNEPHRGQEWVGWDESGLVGILRHTTT